MAATEQSSRQINENGRRLLALVTGASHGIGYELALCCAREGFDLLVAAEEPRIFDAAKAFSAEGAAVEPMQVTLDTIDDVDELYALADGRPVDALLLTVGREPGFGGQPFLAEDVADVRRIIETNVIGTLGLVHRVARDMRARRHGRILLVSSFLAPFAAALREELKGSGVTLTSCPQPKSQGAPRDATAAAGRCFEAMMRGDAAPAAGDAAREPGGRATASFPAARVRTAS